MIQSGEGCWDEGWIEADGVDHHGVQSTGKKRRSRSNIFSCHEKNRKVHFEVSRSPKWATGEVMSAQRKIYLMFEDFDLTQIINVYLVKWLPNA